MSRIGGRAEKWEWLERLNGGGRLGIECFRLHDAVVVIAGLVWAAAECAAVAH